MNLPIPKLSVMMLETMPYIWSKHNIHPLPRALLVDDTLESVRRAVHVETFLAAQEWGGYLRKHFPRMSENEHSFGRYTLFACLLAFEQLENPCDQYIKVLALAAHFALYAHARSKTLGLAVVPPVLQKFIELKMSELTVNKEFLTKLGNHVIRKGYLSHCLVVDKMLLEGSSRQDILQTVARKATIKRLKENREQMESISREYIENHRLTDEAICCLDNRVFELEPRGPPAKKMAFNEKYYAASDLIEDFRKIAEKLKGFDRLMEQARNSLNFKTYMRRGILEAPIKEVISEKLILDCMLNLADYL